MTHSTKKRTPPRAARQALGLALAIAGFSAQAQTEAAAPPMAAASAPAEATPAAPPSQTRVRYLRMPQQSGADHLRVVRREDTVGRVAGQVALNVAFAVLGTGAAVQGFSKDGLGGTTLEALRDDPVSVNPAMSDLQEALSKIATDIYRRRTETALATALTDGSTPEEIEAARQTPKEADSPLVPGSWHLVYENLMGSDELFRLKYGASLGRAGFMRPPIGCSYESEPLAWTQWQADGWQRLREERVKIVARCVEAIGAAPENRW